MLQKECQPVDGGILYNLLLYENSWSMSMGLTSTWRGLLP
jgi:hypothetical protein